jgi:hypothetical protein
LSTESAKPASMQYNWKYVAFAPIKIATKKAGFAARQYAAEMRCEFYA